MMQHNLLGLPVNFYSTESEIAEDIRRAIQIGDPLLVTFINPHAYWIVENNLSYQVNLEQFDIVLPDGIGLVYAGCFCGLRLNRVSFDTTSLAPHVLKLCEDHGFSVFLVGGEPGVADNAASVFQKAYPGLKVAGVSSGYFEDQQRVFEEINESLANVVIVGMGAPRQEDFLIKLKENGWTGVGITCGGYFNQSSSSIQYYPRIIDAINLRFLYRIFREPKRLWRRYLIEYIPFFVALSKHIAANIGGKKNAKQD